MDFYVKAKGDPNYDPRKVHSESEIAQLIGQIETMLFTNKGEVLGQPDFGCNLDDLVYSLGYNEEQIQSTELTNVRIKDFNETMKMMERFWASQTNFTGLDSLDWD